MTHSELVALTAKKVPSLFGCGIVMQEPKSIDLRFVPDVFAVKKKGITFQFEIKVSRKDFHKDKNKPQRIDPAMDVGLYRYYVCPEGMIEADDVRALCGAPWGLIHVNKAGKFIVKLGINYHKNLTEFSRENNWRCDERDTLAEMELMYSNMLGILLSTGIDPTTLERGGATMMQKVKVLSGR